MSSYRVEVIADSSGIWAGNAMRYASRADAEEAANDLSMRWTAVRAWRIQCSPDEPNVRKVLEDPAPEQE